MFRKKWSIPDPILALDTIVKERGRRGKLCHQGFPDIEGAYDSADRSQLWSKCSKMGWGRLYQAPEKPFDHIRLRFGWTGNSCMG